MNATLNSLAGVLGMRRFGSASAARRAKQLRPQFATFQRLGCFAALVLIASVRCLGQSQSEAMRGTPGVATRRAVVNFAELARQAAPSAAASAAEPSLAAR